MGAQRHSRPQLVQPPGVLLDLGLVRADVRRVGADVGLSVGRSVGGQLGVYDKSRAKMAKSFV